MDKSFREKIMPLSEKERLYSHDEEAAGAFYREIPERYGRSEGNLVLPLDNVGAGARADHGAVMPAPMVAPAPTNRIHFNKQTRYSIVPLHRHEYVEMSYVYSGHCTSVIDGATVELAEGDVFILDSGVVHRVLPTGEGDILLNCCMSPDYFSANFISRLGEGGPISRFLVNAIDADRDHDRYMLFHTAGSARFCSLVEQVYTEYFDPGVCSEGVIDSYMYLVFVELVRCYQGEKEEEASRDNRSYLTEVLRYIEENCTDCTLRGTAERFGYHPNYLSRVLKEATGSSFKELVTQRRFERAEVLLACTDDPIGSVAMDCGYANESFFYRKFSERYGCTPGEYRDRSRA